MIGRLLAFSTTVMTAGCYAGHEDEAHPPDAADASDEGDRGRSGADSDAGDDRYGDRDGDASSSRDPDANAAVDPDPAVFVDMPSGCTGQSCAGAPNLVHGGGSSGVSCHDLQDDLDVEYLVGNCGTLATDRDAHVVVRLGEPTGRDIDAETIPAELPPGMAFAVALSIPWVEWRPRAEGTPIFMVIDSEGAVEECNEEDDVVEVGQIGCPF